MPNLIRKGAIGFGVGWAERQGYLARVPEIGQLGAIGSLGLICWGLRRFGHVSMPILDDVTEICVITMGMKLGREGLTSDAARVSGTEIGADEYAIQGDEDGYSEF